MRLQQIFQTTILSRKFKFPTHNLLRFFVQDSDLEYFFETKSYLYVLHKVVHTAGAGAVLEDRGFLDANGEALDEVVVAADAGLDVAAFRAAAEAVVRLASGARVDVGAGLVDEDAVEAEITEKQSII
jgi:hypothetical protein